MGKKKKKSVLTTVLNVIIIILFVIFVAAASLIGFLYFKYHVNVFACIGQINKLNEKVDVLTQKSFIDEYNEFKEYEYRFSDIEPGTVLYIDKKDAIYVMDYWIITLFEV